MGRAAIAGLDDPGREILNLPPMLARQASQREGG
jgi:hypothetical protein